MFSTSTRVALLGGLVLAATASVGWAGGGTPCPPPPCGPGPGGGVMTQKVWVTEYVPEPYETTRTVYKTAYKDEKYTAYRCETEPKEMTRTVTYWKTVPVTREHVVTRYEWQSSQEERTVTRYHVTCKPVERMVTRCVDKGGHYEERQVLCGPPRGWCSCGCGAPATTTVRVYVPNYVTEQVPVTVMQQVVEPKTEKVMVTICKPVAKQETVKVTYHECRPEPREEKYTVHTMKWVPYEAVRKVPYLVPSEEKVTLTRMKPVQVEREVLVGMGGYCGASVGYDGGCVRSCGGGRGGLFRRGCR